MLHKSRYWKIYLLHSYLSLLHARYAITSPTRNLYWILSRYHFALYFVFYFTSFFLLSLTLTINEALLLRWTYLNWISKNPLSRLWYLMRVCKFFIYVLWVDTILLLISERINSEEPGQVRQDDANNGMLCFLWYIWYVLFLKYSYFYFLI
jgi:hypothetical protein